MKSQDAPSAWCAEKSLSCWRGMDAAIAAEGGAPMASTNFCNGLRRYEAPDATIFSAVPLPSATQNHPVTSAATVFPTDVFGGHTTYAHRNAGHDVCKPLSRDIECNEAPSESQKELPSTSVMVRIEDEQSSRCSPVLERLSANNTSASRTEDTRAYTLSTSRRTDNGQTTHGLEFDDCAEPSETRHDSSVHPADSASVQHFDPPQWSPETHLKSQHFREQDARELYDYVDPLRQEKKSMSLSAYLTRKNEQHTPYHVDEAVLEERHREQLDNKQQQIMRLATELDEKDDKIQGLLADEKIWKDKMALLESQLQHLHGVIAEKDTKVDQEAKSRIQQAKELTQLRNKCQSLQDANEDLQAESKKAATERDRAQKDYSQVVYDLGKAHKQLNTMSQEKVSVEEKDFLVREIDKLQTDNEQLREKLKSTEANRSSNAPSSQDRQQTLQMQMHIRELEDEVRRLRCSGASSMPQPPPPPAVSASHRPNLDASYDSHFQMNHDSDYEQEAVGLHSTRRGTKAGRSMTLKDILSAQSSSKTMDVNSYSRQQHSGSTSPIRTGVMSSMEFPGRNSVSRLSTSQGFDPIGRTQSFNPDNWMRRSDNSVGSLLKYDLAKECRASYDTPASQYQNADTALGAPFATEKQPFLNDAVQRRQLEQDLMNLHVEKGQLESRLAKVEQGGLKTMSARMEKTRLEDHVRSLSLGISKLKMRLR